MRVVTFVQFEKIIHSKPGFRPKYTEIYAQIMDATNSLTICKAADQYNQKNIEQCFDHLSIYELPMVKEPYLNTIRKSSAQFVLYAIGGSMVDNVNFTIERYDSNSNSWKLISETSLSYRVFFGAVCFNNTDIYVIGGQIGESVLNEVFALVVFFIMFKQRRMMNLFNDKFDN